MEFFFSENIDNNNIILDSMEFRHCIKVMRNNIGDFINIVDGKGTLYEGEIMLIDKGTCQVKIKNIIQNYCEKKYYIHIGISPIKNHDRLEWFVEKSIEIGVDEISFSFENSAHVRLSDMIMGCHGLRFFNLFNKFLFFL